RGRVRAPPGEGSRTRRKGGAGGGGLAEVGAAPAVDDERQPDLATGRDDCLDARTTISPREVEVAQVRVQLHGARAVLVDGMAKVRGNLAVRNVGRYAIPDVKPCTRGAVPVQLRHLFADSPSWRGHGQEQPRTALTP